MRIANATLECVRGDITAQPELEAVVNAANAQLRPGGGVAGAIHRAAGPGLYQECKPLAPIEPGTAVLTGGHDLPNRHVIHCLGPVHGVDTPSDRLLAACYRNALQLADAHGIGSIGFPAISTGAFGYPVRQAAEVAIATLLEVLPGLTHVRLVRFVLFGEVDLAIHERTLRSLTNPTER